MNEGTPILIGLRDRALIALMDYTCARVGAAIQMRVGDYYVLKRRAGSGCTRRAARSTNSPATIAFELFLEEWLAASGLSAEPDSPLVPT